MATVKERSQPVWQDLKPRWQKVTKEGKVLLRLLSLFYLPTRLTPLRESLKRLKEVAREHRMRGPFEFDIPEALNELEEAELLISEKNAYRLPHELREEVTGELLKSGHLPVIAEVQVQVDFGP